MTDEKRCNHCRKPYYYDYQFRAWLCQGCGKAMSIAEMDREITPPSAPQEPMTDDQCLCTIHSPMDCPDGAVYDPGGWRVPNPQCPVDHEPEPSEGEEPEVDVVSMAYTSMGQGLSAPQPTLEPGSMEEQIVRFDDPDDAIAWLKADDPPTPEPGSVVDRLKAEKEATRQIAAFGTFVAISPELRRDALTLIESQRREIERLGIHVQEASKAAGIEKTEAATLRTQRDAANDVIREIAKVCESDAVYRLATAHLKSQEPREGEEPNAKG